MTQVVQRCRDQRSQPIHDVNMNLFDASRQCPSVTVSHASIDVGFSSNRDSRARARLSRLINRLFLTVCAWKKYALNRLVILNPAVPKGWLEGS